MAAFCSWLCDVRKAMHWRRRTLALIHLAAVAISNVHAADPAPAGDGSNYRTITREYASDSYYTKGLLKLEVTADGAVAKFLETENAYALRDVHAGTAGDAASTVLRSRERFLQAAP